MIHIPSMVFAMIISSTMATELGPSKEHQKATRMGVLGRVATIRIMCLHHLWAPLFFSMVSSAKFECLGPLHFCDLSSGSAL